MFSCFSTYVKNASFSPSFDTLPEGLFCDQPQLFLVSANIKRLFFCTRCQASSLRPPRLNSADTGRRECLAMRLLSPQLSIDHRGPPTPPSWTCCLQRRGPIPVGRGAPVLHNRRRPLPLHRDLNLPFSTKKNTNSGTLRLLGGIVVWGAPRIAV